MFKKNATIDKALKNYKLNMQKKNKSFQEKKTQELYDTAKKLSTTMSTIDCVRESKNEAKPKKSTTTMSRNGISSVMNHRNVFYYT